MKVLWLMCVRLVCVCRSSFWTRTGMTPSRSCSSAVWPWELRARSPTSRCTSKTPESQTPAVWSQHGRRVLRSTPTVKSTLETKVTIENSLFKTLIHHYDISLKEGGKWSPTCSVPPTLSPIFFLTAYHNNNFQLCFRTDFSYLIFSYAMVVLHYYESISRWWHN